jgi:RHS repeat-associated protein
VPGAGAGETLLTYEGAGTGDRRWLYADERGSTVAVTAPGGGATILSYDEDGVPAAGNPAGVRFQYTGQAWLAEAGLHYYKARMYAPNLARFLQTDPIGYAGGINLYAYVGGDPVNRVDPGGLWSFRLEEQEAPPAPVENIVVIGCQGRALRDCIDPRDMRHNVFYQYVNIDTGAWVTEYVGGSEDIVVEARKNIIKDNDDSLLEEKQFDFIRCLSAVGGAGFEGFIDPISITFGVGKSVWQARERIGDRDYGKRLDGSRFPRTLGHATQLGLRRFIPGYFQASLIVGGVRATFEVFSNPLCGLSE